jgi:hypothetical protein
MKTLSRVLPLSLLILMSACGGGAPSPGGPPRHAIKGKVTYGSEQLDGATIAFIPVEGSKRSCGGPITAGEYSLSAENGPNAGDYTVQIRWERPTGKTARNVDTGKDEPLSSNVIPAQYNTMTTLKVTIPAANDTADFTLAR